MSELSSIIGTLQELERMHQLNLELLEQLDVVFTWIIETDVPISNGDKLKSLLSKTHALLKELYFSSPQVMQYRKLSDDLKHGEESDGEVTEPQSALYSFLGSYS